MCQVLERFKGCMNNTTLDMNDLLKLKKLCPSYDINKDVIEGKEEKFNGHEHYTFFMNNKPFYQLHDARGKEGYYFSEETGRCIFRPPK